MVLAAPLNSRMRAALQQVALVGSSASLFISASVRRFLTGGADVWWHKLHGFLFCGTGFEKYFGASGNTVCTASLVNWGTSRRTSTSSPWITVLKLRSMKQGSECLSQTTLALSSAWSSRFMLRAHCCSLSRFLSVRKRENFPLQ